MEHIGEIEKRLWSSADNLRANSNFASNEYFLPVMGLIFLRHAERMHLDPTERATFFGMEKNPTTIRLANMNLAVHGLEGNIQKAITYYEDPHELLGKCDFVMANPPFNVDEVDAEKVKNDPRLPYALPGVNKKGKVLMIDARNVHRKVTRKIYDFTPEQQQNLAAIVWLYRSQKEHFLALVAEHFERMVEAASEASPVRRLAAALAEAAATCANAEVSEGLVQTLTEFDNARQAFAHDLDAFETETGDVRDAWDSSHRDNAGLTAFTARAQPLTDAGRDLTRQADHLHRLLSRVAEGRRNGRGSPLKAVGEARSDAVEHLRAPRYFWRQAHWLQERFPDAALRDVEGLVKLVGHDELAAHDWSLTPGRYVGVAPEEEDEDFDFEQTMRDIHLELDELNAESVRLAATIKRNFQALGL